MAEHREVHVQFVNVKARALVEDSEVRHLWERYLSARPFEKLTRRWRARGSADLLDEQRKLTKTNLLRVQLLLHDESAAFLRVQLLVHVSACVPDLVDLVLKVTHPCILQLDLLRQRLDLLLAVV